MAEHPFVFERDTFAFRNELTWEYQFHPETGRMTTIRNEPPPQYAHRCFVLVRCARQFFYHARFEPQLPGADEATYRRRIGQVISRSPRRASTEAARIVIPGFDCLRAFSRAWESLLKAECGGAWQSYFLRSHWRMILPVPRRHQERMARQIQRSFSKRTAPIVHLFRFPQLTINHGVLLFDRVETDTAIRFPTYDPNQPDHPTELIYDRVPRTFVFPRNQYWAGGRVDVVETYRGWLY